MSTSTEASSGIEGTLGAPVTPVRPPNRPAHERFLEEVTTKLNNLEDRRKFLQDRFKSLRDQQTEFRRQRDVIMEERNQVDAQLASVNKEVNTRSEQVQKLRANIPYLSEDRVNEQIKTLEDQMMKHHYKRSEENKIIQEVNKLKRSKKLIKDHNTLKSELEAMRKRQRQIRERRDFLFRERGDVKKKEDVAKRDSNEIKEELDSIKFECDQLFNSKRQAVAEFRLKESEYKKFLFERRTEQRIKRKEEKEAIQAEKQRELDEIKANAEPFEEELKLISNLIAYCLRFELPNTNNSTSNNENAPNSSQLVTSNGFLAVPGANPHARRGSHESGLRNGGSVAGSISPASNGSSVYATPIGVTPVSTPGVEMKEGGFLYKKDDIDDTLFAGVSKKTSRRNSRNERRNSKAKNLTHNPEIFSQFDVFGLKPPSSTKEVITVMANLKEKQNHFEKLAIEQKCLKLNPESRNADSNHQVEVKLMSPPDTLELNLNKEEEECPAVVSNVGPEVTVTEVSSDSEEGKSEKSKKNKKIESEAFPSLPEPKGYNPGGFFSESKAEETIVVTKENNYSNDLKISNDNCVGVQDL